MGIVVNNNNRIIQKANNKFIKPHNTIKRNIPTSYSRNNMPVMRPRMQGTARLPPVMRPMRPPGTGMRPSLLFRAPPMNTPRGAGPRVPPPTPGMYPPPLSTIRPAPLGMRPQILPSAPHMHPIRAPPTMGGQGHFRSTNPMHHNKPRGVDQGRVIKRKGPIYFATDLNKPWVNTQLKIEFMKKEELLKSAKNTQSAQDWATYRNQRDKCKNIYETAKLEYIGQHPEEDVNKILAETS